MLDISMFFKLCLLVRHCGGETQMKKVTTETDPSLTISHLPPINTNPTVNPSSDFSTLPMVRFNIWSLQFRKINDCHIYLKWKDGTT